MNLQELLAEILNHIRGMWRYRWWATALAWLIAIAGSLYVYSMPDVYRASTRIYVDTESLLRPLMQGLTTAQNTMNDVQLLSRVVLTRPNLERVAYATDLDLRARTPEQMELLITRLQNDLVVSGGRENIFTIQYEDRNREKAREVVAAVRDTFVEGALGNSGSDVEMSERALANEIENHESRLLESEERLARFKQENVGYMPGEYGDYYSRLQGALGRLAETERALDLATNRREELRRQIGGEDPVIGIMPTSAVGGQCTQSSQIAELETQLSSLRVQFTDIHPRVASIRETMAQLREECSEEIEAARADGSLTAIQASPLDANPVYQNLRIQLSDTDVEIAGLRTQLQGQQKEVEQLRLDVDKITQVEADLRQLDRNYEVIRSRHQELLRRWEDLQAKMRLDPVTDGARFETIEPPFALADPVGPNRPFLLGGVLMLSLGAAGALAFVLNQITPVFFTRNALKRVLEYPVIGSITMLLPPSVVMRRRMEAITWSVACALLVVFIGIAVVSGPWAGPLLREFMEGVGV